MKLEHLTLSGFRGFRAPVSIRFAAGFTVIDGRNGVGKSTICDAIEFALTGDISKYKDAKADRESVSDYIWWRGDEPASDYYVELAFVDTDDKAHVIRRERHSRLQGSEVLDLLVDKADAPRNALRQLCETLIIRDELIAHLSLDQTETARFQFLRAALGSIDSDEITRRASSLHQAAKRQLELADEIAATSRTRLTTALRRMDEARSALADDRTVSAATDALRTMFGSSAPVEELASSIRPQVAALRRRISALERVLEYASSYSADLSRVEDFARLKLELEEQIRSQETILARQRAALKEITNEISAQFVEGRGKTLNELVSLGEELGLNDGKCPLCGATHTEASFEAGLAASKARAAEASARVLEFTGQRRDLERSIAETRERLSVASASLNETIDEISSLRERVSTYDALSLETGVPPNVNAKDIRQTIEEERRRAVLAEGYIGTLETLSFNSVLVASTSERVNADREIRVAEKRLAHARQVESWTKAILNAVKRASAETLDRRLERIGPLLGELYRRLKPHPVWEDIDYKVRGDVQRFLKLEVGDALNPQFLFSSGQRRATGIAFLLSVFLSTSWRRLNSIILDDPVQHIDDFRAVHLAELLAQLSGKGLQIVCAVEDAALADLLCRRIPSSEFYPGRRFTLGLNADGNLGVAQSAPVSPLKLSVLPEIDSIVSSA